MDKERLQILQNFIYFLGDEIEKNESTVDINDCDEDGFDYGVKSFSSMYMENTESDDVEIYLKVDYDITSIETYYRPATHDNPSENEIISSYTLYDIVYEEDEHPMPCPIDINKLEHAINETSLRSIDVKTLLKPGVLQKNEGKNYKNKKTVITLSENKLKALIKNYIKEIVN